MPRTHGGALSRRQTEFQAMGVKYKYRKVEQKCPEDGSGPAGRRFVKKLTVRAMRRAAKADPENAPKKPKYSGYSA